MRRPSLPIATAPALIAAFLAIALSSFRFAMGPGLEFYLGPIFYLLALRWFGLGPGLVAALICMTPTIFWWDHPVSVLLALLHVLFVWRFLRRGWTTAGATLLFHLTIGAVAGATFLHVFYDVPASIVCVQLLRKLINETLLAAMADCVSLLFVYSAERRMIERSRNFRLSAAITKSLLLFGMVMTTLLFRTEVQFFSLYLTARIHDLDASVLARSSQAGPGETHLVIDETPVTFIRIPQSLSADAERRLVRSYKCRFVEDDSATTDATARSRFDYWVDGCRLHYVHDRGGRSVYVAPLREIALDGYDLIFEQSFKFLLMVVVAVGAGAIVRRTLATSAERWRDVVAQFGQGEISQIQVAPIAEFQASIDTFVEANNRFVRMQKERDQTRSTMATLSEALNLSLIESIGFDPATGDLTFRRIEESGGGLETVRVRRADCHNLGELGGAQDISVEFRIEGEASDRWHLIVARDRTGPHRWASGCILRLRPARYAIEQLAHHARLTELGAMATAIGHELKQPLFSISLSSELGIAELARNPGSAGDAQRRFDQINRQVERARQIIARMSQYARSDVGTAETFRAVDAVYAAAAFLRPMLVAKDVAITVGGDLDPMAQLRMRRIGLEQIVVNALQNSLDSIETRLQRAPGGERGRITIACRRKSQGIEVRICDNGVGLDGISGDEAFQAFATTKSVGKGTGLGLYISREIAVEIGGTIQLSSGAEGGAEFLLSIPESAIVQPDHPNECAA